MRVGEISLRPAVEDDASFAFRCERETMREYAEATWGTWPAEKVRARTLAKIRAGKTEIVERDGEPIGILRVVRSAEDFHLQQIFLLPGHQNRGIGSALVRDLIEEASGTGVPVRLRVLRVNPARRLYRRLGFTLVDTTPEHECYEHAPLRRTVG